jgi:hypothetical protein
VNKHFNLLFLLLLCAASLQAQVPGYMGKRAFIQLELNPTPALFNMNMNNTVSINIGDEARTDKQNLMALNIKPQINFEYLLGQSFALAINYHQIITGTVKEVEYDYYEDRYDLIKGDGAGITMKFYKFKKSGSVAPLGRYGSLGFNLARINSYNRRGDERKQFRNDLYYPVVSWGFGKQFMPVNNVLISTGAEFGWTFSPTHKGEEPASDEHALSIDHVHSSMFGYNFFNLKVSVGYMLF